MEWLRSGFVSALMERPLRPPMPHDAQAVACEAAAAAAADSTDAEAEKQLARLPPQMAAEVSERRDRVVECLRFFYSCFPPTQRGAKERVARLAMALGQQRDELLRLKKALPRDQPEITHAVERRLNTLLEMLNAALDRFDAANQPGGAAGGSQATGKGGAAMAGGTTSTQNQGGWQTVA